jgi:hypothetical protein
LQDIAADILNNDTSDSVTLANYLSLYIQSTANLNGQVNKTVSVVKIDDVVSQINATNIAVNSTSSFLMAQAVDESDNLTVLGASFVRGSGGRIITTENQNSVINFRTLTLNRLFGSLKPAGSVMENH